MEKFSLSKLPLSRVTAVAEGENPRMPAERIKGASLAECGMLIFMMRLFDVGGYTVVGLVGVVSGVREGFPESFFSRVGGTLGGVPGFT